MSNIEVHFNDNNIDVYIDDTYMGNIVYSINPYHNGHFYLNLQLQQYDTGVAKELFDLISKKLDKPLQIMLSSEEKDTISFIQKAGFNCKRKCYEVEAGKQDYIGDSVEGELWYSFVGEESYEQCCKLMLNRYILTHRNINPWTGTKEEFFSELPECVVCLCMDGKIACFAFVEDDEIAYVYGENVQFFHKFAQVLVTELFQKYEVITFEADDCDEIAMKLKSMFINQSEESFDTYMRNSKE